MNKQKQKGSLEIIGIMIVILLLVGGVGFIAWNNFVKKGVTSSAVKETEKTEPKKTREYKTAQIAESFPVKLSTRYPANWILNVEGDGPKAGSDDAVQQKISITSPSKEYTASYTILMRGGIGGICDPDTNGVIRSISKDPVAGLGNVLFVEMTAGGLPTDSGEEAFRYVSGLYSSLDRVKDVKVGDSVCELGLINLIKLPDDNEVTIVDANVKINKLQTLRPDGTYSTIMDLASIKSGFESAEYKDAVQILKSMKLSK